MLNCECCCKRAITTGCYNCTTYHIKKTIESLRYEIGHIECIWNYKYFINRIYAKDILENIDFYRIDYLISPKMEADQIVIRVDKRAINDYTKIRNLFKE